MVAPAVKPTAPTPSNTPHGEIISEKDRHCAGQASGELVGIDDCQVLGSVGIEVSNGDIPGVVPNRELLSPRKPPETVSQENVDGGLRCKNGGVGDR